MVIINDICYEYKRLKRFENIAGALLHKPKSSFKHFTFIVKGTRILSIGYNDIQRHSKLAHYPLGGIHSEADAIGNLSDLNLCRRATLINVRLNNRKELRNAKPCDTCFSLIQRMGFKRIYYSTNYGFEFLDLRNENSDYIG
jgi:deoxycytidylate deaminase